MNSEVTRRLVVLGGSGEASALVDALAALGGVDGVVSLSRAGRDSFRWPVRVGKWKSEDAFADWLRDEGISAVMDATHPFATSISERAWQVSRRCGLPYLRLERPEWTPSEGDRWTLIDDEAEAADVIPEGATVFVVTGRRSLAALAALDGRKLIIRTRAPTAEPCPLPQGEFRHDPPPYTEAGEARLFASLGVDWLLTRNSGGIGSWPKIAAARALNIPVAMVRRPVHTGAGESVQTVDEAIAWVRKL